MLKLRYQAKVLFLALSLIAPEARSSEICELFGICEAPSYRKLNTQDCRTLFGGEAFTANRYVGDLCGSYILIEEFNAVTQKKELHFLQTTPQIVKENGQVFGELSLVSGQEALSLSLNAGRLSPRVAAELQAIIEAMDDNVDRPLPYIGTPKQSIAIRLLAERSLYEIADSMGILRPANPMIFREVKVEPYQNVDFIRISAQLTPYGARIFEKAWTQGRSLSHVISVQIEHEFASLASPVKAAVVGTLPCIQGLDPIGPNTFSLKTCDSP